MEKGRFCTVNYATFMLTSSLRKHDNIVLLHAINRGFAPFNSVQLHTQHILNLAVITAHKKAYGKCSK